MKDQIQASWLTNGILEALSFHTANSPKPAKQLKPPQSQANASYYFQNHKNENKMRSRLIVAIHPKL